ncbi:hypothetical protein TSOC111612_00890 [Tsukamurella ocularis]|uniref:dGTP triphosphohydrolase n=1 Tax=Tsukamurella ocularis TaxID=1970234 RepID=UPI0039F01FE3
MTDDAASNNRSLSSPDKDTRSVYERDLDRLLYTLYFRRLSGITQVASLSVAESGEYGLVHNRLTHSLKVGQVARRMTQYLLTRSRDQFAAELDYESVVLNLDPDVAEFAGRAHDIGHPPFGHLGEKVLSKLAETHGLEDGFEGNAQTFRVLTSLARRRPVRPKATDDDEDFDPMISLELTDKSLASTVKYPFAIGQGPKDKNEAGKFGYIAPDSRYFQAKVQPLLNGARPTLEAQIMDWADDITYATHDIEDFGANGRIPLSLLRHDSALKPVSWEEVEEFKNYAQIKLSKKNIDFPESFKLFRKLLLHLPARIVPGSADTAASLGRMTSRIITQATDKTTIDSDGNLDPNRTWVGAIEILKLLTWYYVIDDPDLVRIQRGQKRRLTAVAEELAAWTAEVTKETKSGESYILRRRLPQQLGDLVVSYAKANNGRGLYPDNPRGSMGRAVIDFVASMTENDVESYYHDMCR